MSKKINNVVFIIGPSGIGKSSLLRNIKVNSKTQLYELDSLVYEAAKKYSLVTDGGAYQVLKSIGNQAFFILGMNFLFEKIASSSFENTIVDVGAAFQNVEILQKYSILYNVILVDAKPKISHERYITNRPKDKRDFLTHCNIEYSPVRINLYNSASYRLDTTSRSLLETSIELDNILKGIWNE